MHFLHLLTPRVVFISWVIASSYVDDRPRRFFFLMMMRYDDFFFIAAKRKLLTLLGASLHFFLKGTEKGGVF